MSLTRHRIEQVAMERQARKAARLGVLCTPQRDPVRAVVGGGTRAAVPKGPPAKPGKGTPTKDEAAWMDAIVAFGCICCRMLGNGYVYPEIHHILRGGRRMGHKFTLPLCFLHHKGGARYASRHPWQTQFIERYGEEMALLSTLQGVLKLQPDGTYSA